jgi:hypothetical protein
MQFETKKKSIGMYSCENNAARVLASLHIPTILSVFICNSMYLKGTHAINGWYTMYIHVFIHVSC